MSIARKSSQGGQGSSRLKTFGRAGSGTTVTLPDLESTRTARLFSEAGTVRPSSTCGRTSLASVMEGYSGFSQKSVSHSFLPVFRSMP